MPEVPVWERPWSLGELRGAATDWTLAADAGLLLHLEEFSKRILARTIKIQKQVDGLLHETKSTDTRIHNVFNQFLMLSNTQFIENRVYEDKVPIVEDEKSEEETAAAAEKDKTTEERQAEIIPKFTQAMQGGLATLDASFTKMFEVPEEVDEDGDELPEDYEPDLILEPHNPYVRRTGFCFCFCIWCFFSSI